MKSDTVHNAKKPSPSQTKAAGFSEGIRVAGNASGARPGYSSQSRWETLGWLVIVLSLVAIWFSWVVTLVLLIGD